MNTFTIEIERWTSEIKGRKLPICKIVAPTSIENATMDFVAFSSEKLDINAVNGHYMTSFILWSDARVHAEIGDIHVIIVNLEDRVVAVLYSAVDFVTDASSVNNVKGVWHSFAILQGEEKIQVHDIHL